MLALLSVAHRRALPAASLSLALVLCGAGCGDKKAKPTPSKAKVKAKTPSKAKAKTKPTPSKAKGKAKAAKPKIKALSPKQRKAYMTALAKGRKLAKTKKWADAIKSFEAALKVLPMDGRALSELGWAAFQVGNYPLALDANKKSVLAATEDKVKAASLYNLGRTAEAMGNKDLAAVHYRRSLILRLHRAVEKRLRDLGKKAPVASLAPRVEETCGVKKADTIEAICACLLKEHSGPGLRDGKPSCAVHKALKTHSDKIKAIKLDLAKQGIENYYLATQLAPKKWKLAAKLAEVYNPGAFGISEEFSFGTPRALDVTVPKAGKRKLLTITGTKNRHDSDMGIDEYETRRVVTLTACYLPPEGDAKAVPRCVLQIAIDDDYKRDVLGISDEPKPKDLVARHKKLPIRQRTKLAVTISRQAVATITLVGGTKTKAVAPLIGEHKLY